MSTSELESTNESFPQSDSDSEQAEVIPPVPVIKLKLVVIVYRNIMVSEFINNF